MKRRDLLRSLGGTGAVTAAGRLLDPVVARRQSLPAASARSTLTILPAGSRRR
jgi:hypothetical protein